MNGIHYCIDGTGRAIDFKTLKVYSEKSIINNFNNYCANDNVVDAFCQIDRDSDEQVKEGMTTYGVRTKDSRLMTIAIHENNYAACKDQMAILGSSVKKAQEKIKNKRSDIVRKVVAGGVVTVATGLVIWAGAIKLDDWFKNKKAEPEKPAIESTTEDDYNGMTDAIEATPAEATPTDDSSSLENMDSEQVKQIIDESNQNHITEQKAELEQRREELGLGTEATNSNYSYGYNQIVNNADATKSVIDEYNAKNIKEQQKYLEDLRQDYEQQYKVR